MNKIALIFPGIGYTRIPLYLTDGANHSLETGDISFDIQNLSSVMDRVKDFILNRPQ